MANSTVQSRKSLSEIMIDVIANQEIIETYFLCKSLNEGYTLKEVQEYMAEYLAKARQRYLDAQIIQFTKQPEEKKTMYDTFSVIIRPFNAKDFLKELHSIDPEAKACVLETGKYNKIQLCTEITPNAIALREDVLHVDEDSTPAIMLDIDQGGNLI